MGRNRTLAGVGISLFHFTFKALLLSTSWVRSGALKLLSGVQGGKAGGGGGEKGNAPGEARTHGLQIMRLTRCLLRYRGKCFSSKVGSVVILWSQETLTCILHGLKKCRQAQDFSRHSGLVQESPKSPYEG